MKTPYQFLALIILAVFLQLELTAAPKKVGYPSFLSPHARPILVHDNRVFVANTPSDTVDVIDTCLLYTSDAADEL